MFDSAPRSLGFCRGGDPLFSSRQNGEEKEEVMKREDKVNTFGRCFPCVREHHHSQVPMYLTKCVDGTRIVFGEGMEQFHPRVGRNVESGMNTSFFTPSVSATVF